MLTDQIKSLDWNTDQQHKIAYAGNKLGTALPIKEIILPMTLHAIGA